MFKNLVAGPQLRLMLTVLFPAPEGPITLMTTGEKASVNITPLTTHDISDAHNDYII
jgi:hypothetical protein